MALLFDFNGTMFFDEAFQEKSWRAFIEGKIGRQVSEEEFQTQIHGRNADITLQYFLNRTLSRQEILELEEEKEQIYRSLCLASDKFLLAPGLEDYLEKAKKKRIPMNIATASGKINVDFFFQYMGLGQWFDRELVVYNDGLLPGKPAPDLYLLAAKRLGVAIEDCYVFEDSRSGIEAAKRAKAKGIIRLDSMKGTNLENDASICRTIQNYKELDEDFLV